MRTRRSPRRNITATDLMDFLDRYATIEVDLDLISRSYIHGVWVDPVHKREIRRYRNGQVKSIRPETLQNLLSYFNLETQWLNAVTQ